MKTVNTNHQKTSEEKDNAMTTQPSGPLFSAMMQARIPEPNYHFVQQLLPALDISIVGYRFVEQPTKPYVRATRADGRPDLQIYFGYTTGFTPEDDVARVAGSEAVREPQSTWGAWYVKHPINRVREGGKKATGRRRITRRCGCGMELSLTGQCGSCD